MFKDWDSLIIKKIALAMFVPPKSGSITHNDRPFHGLVFNAKGKSADYIFTSGTILKTEEYSLFFTQRVKL